MGGRAGRCERWEGGWVCGRVRWWAREQAKKNGLWINLDKSTMIVRVI